VATPRDFAQQERISDEWVEQLRARNIKLFRQDETGAVELEFGERKWQARAISRARFFAAPIGKSARPAHEIVARISLTEGRSEPDWHLRRQS
jgi:hypothetical protein